LNEIPDGGAMIVQVDEKLRIGVFRAGDKVAAIDNRCPHAGASLAEGTFDGTTVKCPLHGFRVNVWKGVGSAGKPVRTFPVSLNGEEVTIVVGDPRQL
jgi:nitrite reductase/ring-hydroxylating ferredoxin subunit